LNLLTLMKNESARILAVVLCGSNRECRVFGGNENWLSMILCRLGSVVKRDCPATDSTIILISCKNEREAESPT